MKRLGKSEMYDVLGGTDFSYSMLNAISKAVSVIFELGQSIGSSIRRIMDGMMCKFE